MAVEGSGWGFYGRERELTLLKQIFDRGRWFFLKATGRRRIGKTTLVQRALPKDKEVFYAQIPDSEQAGVLSAVSDALETFRLSDKFARPTTFIEFGRMIEEMARQGYVIVLDEFQYFNRKHLNEFTSFLQMRVDRLLDDSNAVSGGLIVLGSIHTEMSAILDDRYAPLYGRTTDEIELPHLEVSAVASIVRSHADASPERLLFLWNLFEGVPKFYRDAFEQKVMGATRKDALHALFFRSSSPLRGEADNWFLKELRGRYDVVLKYVARHAGCDHAELKNHISSSERSDQVGTYLKVLIDRYRMVERRMPIFSPQKARRGRYYLTDNFLRSWLSALANPVSALNFRSVEDVLNDADQRLKHAEGYGLEKLAGALYHERSRKAVGDFSLTHQIDGYWSSDTEIDLVAVDEENHRIRFGSCKRAPGNLVTGAKALDGHVDRFLKAKKQYADWTIDKVAIAPTISPEIRKALEELGHIPQSIDDLLEGLV